MPGAFCLACLLAFAVGAEASRVAAKETHAAPWRKASLVGLLLARRGSLGLPERQSDVVLGQELEQRSDAYDRAGARLLALFPLPRPPDEALVRKLLEHLRNKDLWCDLILQIEAGLRDGGLVQAQKPSAKSSSTSAGEAEVEQFLLTQKGGGPCIQIDRHLARQRRPEEVRALQNMLRASERVNAKARIFFLRIYAASHTAEELAQDEDSEVLVMLEPTYGTLRKFLSEHRVGIKARLHLFMKAFNVARQLRKAGIPHKSVLTPDSLFVRGDVANSASLDVAPSLSIYLFEAELSADESFDGDLRQLGNLLMLLLRPKWPAALAPRVDFLLVWAEALASGMVHGEEEAVDQFAKVFQVFSSPQEDIGELLRLDFQRRGEEEPEVTARGSVA